MKKPQKLNFLAPAKINLSLYVLHRREDGYHEIESLIVPVTLFDFVSISTKEGEIEVICSGNVPVPEDEDNIAFAAASLFLDYFGLNEGVRIEIEKKIPAGSGLGGGSSDAAAVLKGMSMLILGELRAANLLEIASRVGSDVPFFIYPSSAIVSGRGEKITRLDFRKMFHILIVKPDVSMSTAEAYRLLNRTSEPVAVGRRPPDVVDDLDDLKESLHNDFEEVVFEKCPEAEDLKKKMLNLGASAALLSGSGSAVFGLFERKEEAEKARRGFDHDEGVFVKIVSNF